MIKSSAFKLNSFFSFAQYLFLVIFIIFIEYAKRVNFAIYLIQRAYAWYVAIQADSIHRFGILNQLVSRLLMQFFRRHLYLIFWYLKLRIWFIRLYNLVKLVSFILLNLLGTASSLLLVQKHILTNFFDNRKQLFWGFYQLSILILKI